MTKRKKPDAAEKPKATKRSIETPNKAGLTHGQQKFVDELLADEHMVGWKAYQRAFRCSNQRSCEQGASRLLSLVKVKQAIANGMKERSERIKYNQDDMLRHLVMIATADPNDIVQYRRDCCRHCHGINHQFQWRDEDEFANALIAATENRDDDDDRPLPSNEGGYGYSPKREPHPDCPKCDGDGIGHMHLEDTRFLSGPARLLYAGIEQTKEGLKPKMHDQMQAATMVARHLGMFNDKLTLKGDKENPLRALLESLPGNTLKPVDEGD